MSKSFERLGMIARWRPVHRGHEVILHTLCEQSSQVLVGIGSSNRYNVRNPFTLEETMDMLKLVLGSYDNYVLMPVPDLGDGPRWRDMVIDMFEVLDHFVTDNPYVASLLAGPYDVIRPLDLLTDEQKIPVSGTMVRRALARGEAWQHFLPDEVSRYLLAHGLDERFRREFGLQTLALDSVIRN